jgi:hypothetical protein
MLSVFINSIVSAQTAVSPDVGVALTLGDCIRRAALAASTWSWSCTMWRSRRTICRSRAARSIRCYLPAREKDQASFPRRSISLRSRSDTLDTQVGIAQRMWSGTIVDLRSSLDRLTSAPSLADFNPSYSSGLTLNLTQPLTRGFGSIKTVPI